MKMTTKHNPRTTVAAAIIGVLLATTACASASDDTAPTAATTDAESSDRAASTVFDSTSVHTIEVEIDDAGYQELLAAYRADGSKEWIEATVTIDGTAYTSAGLRLKGNSSLRQLGGGRGDGDAADDDVAGGASSDAPEDLPWLIKLDKYRDGQAHEGITDFVVRSNTSETALNEAVALELLEAAGLASQDAISVRFSVNGSVEVLRLVIEHPDDIWMADTLDAGGALYKAESTGDYSYRGDQPDAYDDVFDQEAGKDNADLAPLIEFLDFVNNADDETFAAEIGNWLDVDSFATYLAMQEIVQNFDDIDGPGNNSYLFYDAETGQFTVVPWDHNLAFGDAGFGIGSGPGGEPTDGTARPEGARPTERPERPEPPDGIEPGEGIEPGDRAEGAQPPNGVQPDGFGGEGGEGGPPGPGGQSNVLVERMQALDEFASLYEQRLAELTDSLIDSGVAADIAATWAAVLEDEASDLVSIDTIAAETEQLINGL